jgi:hypothetical protein
MGTYHVKGIYLKLYYRQKIYALTAESINIKFLDLLRLFLSGFIDIQFCKCCLAAYTFFFFLIKKETKKIKAENPPES